ncbi:MAG: hypothetical protein LBP69_01330 [Treponema sp.]|jgi:hypothetical protein|nr:hypothetical protein [Treponema sp.]
MNEALEKGWTRELCFYYEKGNEEFYINDEDIKNGVVDNTEIWAREGNIEKKIGKRKTFPIKNDEDIVIATYYGVQHMGEVKYERNADSAERICIPIVENEGDGLELCNNNLFNYIFCTM